MQYSKAHLYQKLQKKLDSLGITNDWYPLKAVDIVKQIPGFTLKFHKFESIYIGAVLIRGNRDGIMANANKSSLDQNFDIAHELIHYWFHPAADSYLSLDMLNQNSKLEWEANEGAAELLVPYQDFIPRFLRIAKVIEENHMSITDLYRHLSKHYGVQEIVIDYRIQNLDTEIMQYHFGANLQNITLSKAVKPLDRQKKTYSLTKEFLNQLKKQGNTDVNIGCSNF